jgi:hypothetical protein
MDRNPDEKEEIMKKTGAFFILMALVIFSNPGFAFRQDALKIWREFVSALKNDRLTLENIRPPDHLSEESQLQILSLFRANAVWEEWEVEPEIVKHGDLITFIISLKQKSKSAGTYTFNFIVENGQWYFRFLEGIVIRLDKVTSLPASEFPDLPEARKAWIRQESYWSKMIGIYNSLVEAKGKDYAMGIFLDGAGYALAATVWIPFFRPSRSFILYLCWEQANLHGNKVTLEKLEDNEATVRFDDLQYFALYMRTSHLKQQISLEDYIGIFEAIWQDRAKNAGWNLEIEGKGRQIVFHFTRQEADSLSVAFCLESIYV